MNKPFWETKTLAEMNHEEWESLCDGCGHCCLVYLEDEDSGDIVKTSASCRLLDIESCRCSDYENRVKKVPTCLKVTVDNIDEVDWLPDTCAYKLIAAGKVLPEWHPLINNTVNESGVSVRAFAHSEEFVHPEQLQDCIISSK